MNQVNNLIQFKNLTDDEKAGYDFANNGYSSQDHNSTNWSLVINAALNPEHGNGFEVYRLVIEEDKFYVTDFEGDINTVLGKFIIDENENDELRISEYLSIRPATADEIPKPKREFKDGAFYPFLYNGVKGIGEYCLSLDRIGGLRVFEPNISWIGEELKIEWGEG